MHRTFVDTAKCCLSLSSMSRLPFESCWPCVICGPNGHSFPSVTLISIVGVALGVAVLSSSSASMSGFDHDLREKIWLNSHLKIFESGKTMEITTG